MIPDLHAWRLAAWDTPFWVNPNREARRYNAVGDGPVQYWALHPLGPWAEYCRAQGIRDGQQLRDLRIRLWVGRFSVDPLRVGYGDVAGFGLEPGDLVDDDHGPCQSFGSRCIRGDGPSVIEVPSAALPGTTNLVLFGPRVAVPYAMEPVDSSDLPATVCAEDGHALAALLPYVRHAGAAHAELVAWSEGRPFSFAEPAPPQPLPTAPGR